MSNSTEKTSNRFSMSLSNNPCFAPRSLAHSTELIIHCNGKNYYSIKIQQKSSANLPNTINYNWSKSNETGLVCDDETYF